MPDLWVAFLRNVNQGQRGHPSTADLARAFGPGAVPFRSNGTVVFEAAEGESVSSVATGLLEAESGRETIVVTRPLDVVARIVDGFGGSDRRELTVFDGPDPAGASDLATHERRGACRIVASGVGWAVVENDRDRRSNGTPLIEATLGVPATSRGMPTLVALVDRFGRPSAGG